jgi:hypothetical protein
MIPKEKSQHTDLDDNRQNSHTFFCEPLSEHFVVIRCNINGHSFKMEFSEQLLKPEDTLVQQCLLEGGKYERAPGIIQHELKHTSGVTFVYKNGSESKTMEEEIMFDMNGLQLKDDPSQNIVKFKLAPGEQKVI